MSKYKVLILQLQETKIYYSKEQENIKYYNANFFFLLL